MKTYCICMSHETERKEMVQSQFDQASIDFEFVDGVVGKNLTQQEIQANVNQFMKYFGHKGTIGCAMSHLKCWQKAKDENLDAVMICESDVKLCDNFQAKLNGVLAELKDANVDDSYDILFLGTVEFNPTKSLGSGWVVYRSVVNLGNPERKQLTANVWKPDISLGTHCYIVTRAGYNKLISEIQGKINGHIDHQMMLLADRVNYLCVYPNIATQQTTQSQSTVNESRFPNVINTVLDKPNPHHFSDAYILNCPVAQIGGYNINYWTLIYLIIGIIILFVDASDKNVLLLYAVFVVFNTLPLPSANHRGTVPEMCQQMISTKVSSAKTILIALGIIILPSKIYKYCIQKK